LYIAVILEIRISVRKIMKEGTELLTRMHAVMTNMWEVEEMPKDWEEGIICPTFREGDVLNSANYMAQYILQFFFQVSYVIE
jgi:hypothetical protein